MEKVKELSKELIVKIKVMIGIVIAGLVVAAAAWRKHVQDELATVEQKAKEQALKDEAAAKLAEETAKLEAEKKAKEAEIEAESAKKVVEIMAKETEKKEELKKLAKEDKQKFKKEVESKLGVKEKKKGRPKK
jgi:colicin import membrane protein